MNLPFNRNYIFAALAGIGAWEFLQMIFGSFFIVIVAIAVAVFVGNLYLNRRASSAERQDEFTRY